MSSSRSWTHWDPRARRVSSFSINKVGTFVFGGIALLFAVITAASVSGGECTDESGCLVGLGAFLILSIPTVFFTVIAVLCFLGMRAQVIADQQHPRNTASVPAEEVVIPRLATAGVVAMALGAFTLALGPTVLRLTA